MKKLVLLTLAATVVAGSAFAAAPVTKISDGSTKVQADYAFKQHVSNGGGNSNDGFGVSLQHDLSNKAALQYSYDKLNAKNGDIKGGKTERNNLQMLCKHHNSLKSNY